jgi:hypothetical protein
MRASLLFKDKSTWVYTWMSQRCRFNLANLSYAVLCVPSSNQSQKLLPDPSLWLGTGVTSPNDSLAFKMRASFPFGRSYAAEWPGTTQTDDGKDPFCCVQTSRLSAAGKWFLLSPRVNPMTSFTAAFSHSWCASNCCQECEMSQLLFLRALHLNSMWLLHATRDGKQRCFELSSCS